MARRRREVVPEAEGGTDTAPVIEGPGPQATLTMKGSAESVKRQMGIGTPEALKPPPEKKDGNGHDDEKQKFVDSLRNPRFLVRIKRQSPRALAGHCWDAECPIAYTKLQDETRDGWGGGTFRAVVVDPESNKTVTADHFEIPGEPIMPESEMSAEEQQKIFMQGGPKSATEMSEDGLDRRARLSAKMLEVEALEAQLEDARKRRAGHEKQQPQENARIDELDRKLTEAKHQAELEARDRKHDEEMRELKALIAQNAKPQRAEGPSEVTMLIQQMQKSQEASDKRFEALQKQMQDDKLNALLEEVKSIKNRPQPQNNMLEMAETMLKLNKMISGVRGDDEDEDEADDKDDDRPWWEKALDKLGGKLGDQLFAKFTNMEEKGEKVDRAKFMAEMAEYADQVAAQATAKIQSRPLPPAPAVPPALPAPAIQRPAVTIPPAPATSLPPPPPPAAPVDAPAAPVVEVPPAPAPQIPQRYTIEQETAIRVGGVLEMIMRESELRPHEYVWNYEGAYSSLPEAILEKVCMAPDPVTMIDAFLVPGITADGLAGIKTQISGNPRAIAWLKVGHDELKTWWAEKQKDPRYDPFAGEEGEEG